MVEKLKIQPLDPSQLDAFYVQFNPNSYSITKPVTWSELAKSPLNATDTNRDLNAPPLQFGGGNRRTLTLQLFFDTTEGAENDVRLETNKIVALTRIERIPKVRNAQPPVCSLSWGKESPTGSDFPFRGVVTNLIQNFTLFHSTGRPLRANLTVVFTEFLDADKDKKETDPDFTTYVVKLGDTIGGIAAAVYQDPAQWRVIADANRVDDPRRLIVGSRLAIPKLV